MTQSRDRLTRHNVWLALWVAVQGESAIMSNGLGSTAVAAILLLAAAPSVIHGGDYSVRADQSVRSVQRWAQASQLSQAAEPSTAAEQLGQESSLSGPPAPSVGNSPVNLHSGTPGVVLDDQEVSAILGKSVRSNAGEEMGRIIDVIVGRDGQIHAAIIDFGGFLGIGTRKIAVDWNALDFAPVGKPAAIVLELTRNQVRLAPQYKRGEPLVVVGTASGAPAARAAAAPERQP
jgi:sporulation protein YlmC with PRC-barrel domain